MKRILGKAVLGLVLLAGVGAWWWGLPAYRVRQAANALDAHDLDRAEVLITALVAQSPGSAQVQLLHSRLLRHKGRWQEAQKAFLTAQGLGLGEEEVRRERMLLGAYTQFRDVEPALKQDLEKNPGDVEIIEVLAEGYGRNGKLQDADEMFARWEKLAPEHAELYFKRALMFKDATHLYRAIPDFRTFLRLHPDHFVARLFLADCLLGDARMAEAAVELEMCRKMQPDNPDPLIGQANCIFDSKPVEARDLLVRALELQPNSVNALLDLAKWDMQFQKIEGAIGRLEKVLSIDADNKQAHLRLGQCYRRQGEQARTKAEYHERRYRELDKRNEDLSKQPRGMR